MLRRVGTCSFTTVKQQEEVLIISVASEQDLEPVQDSIQFIEQEWKGEWNGQCIKGHSVQEQTTNTASLNCPRRLRISRTAVKRWQSLPSQRFVVELGHSHRVHVWRCWWNSGFPMGFSRESGACWITRETMNSLFWCGYCPEPEHSVEEHCVSSLLSQEPIVSLDRSLKAEWKIFVVTNIVIF